MVDMVIEPMTDANLWDAFENDGVTPSSEISVTEDFEQYYFGDNEVSINVIFTIDSEGHSIRNIIADFDLSEFDELRFWIKSNRSTDETYFLRLRLASTLVPLGDVANSWNRYFPVTNKNSWELIRINIEDLDIQIRDAINAIEITCIESSIETIVNIEALHAVREEMSNDNDAALILKLSNKVNVDGDLVPAVIFHADNPVSQDFPYIQITQYNIRPIYEKHIPHKSKSDFSDDGYKLRPMSVKYEIYYEIDVFTENRSDKGRIIDFILRELSPSGFVYVNNILLPIRWVNIDTEDLLGNARSERMLLHFKIENRQEIGEFQDVVPPHNEVVVAVDSLAS